MQIQDDKQYFVYECIGIESTDVNRPMKLKRDRFLPATRKKYRELEELYKTDSENYL